VTEHEKLNRKAASKDLKQKIADLRQIVNAEKKSLQDKVQTVMQILLRDALKDKIKADKNLKEQKDILYEKDTRIEYEIWINS
jgi:hypothetical protein